MNTELSPLEKALYQRELNQIIDKIRKPIAELREILTKELSGTDRLDLNSGDLQEIETWIQQLPALGQGYYGGYYLTVPFPHEKGLPSAVNRAIVRNAVAKHLALMDELDEVRNIAEQAHYNSSNQ